MTAPEQTGYGVCARCEQPLPLDLPHVFIAWVTEVATSEHPLQLQNQAVEELAYLCQPCGAVARADVELALGQAVERAL